MNVHYLDSNIFITCSLFFGHATHQDLFTQLTQALFKLDINKMFQVSMDGPNVNLRSLEKLQKDCLENEQYELVNVRSCRLHTIHGAFKTGAESTS